MGIERVAAGAPIHPLIAARWSPRAFDGSPIGRAELDCLLEAARWAPSSRNEQPWRMVVASRADGEPFERMLSCLAPANAEWACHAGALLLTAAWLLQARGDRPNRYAVHDTALATQNLLLQATALGLAAHPMGGFDREKATAVLLLPPECEPVAMVAVGRPGSHDRLSPEGRAEEMAPRERRPLAEWVHRGVWGTAWQAGAARAETPAEEGRHAG